VWLFETAAKNTTIFLHNRPLRGAARRARRHGFAPARINKSLTFALFAAPSAVVPSSVLFPLTSARIKSPVEYCSIRVRNPSHPPAQGEKD
jgi:hypothetical protein